VISFPEKGLVYAMGSKLYYGNTFGAFKLDMTNMTAEYPESAAAARSAAARSNNSFELNNDNAIGKVTRFKKIDNSFLTLKDAVIE
jgi:hypothetical protein